MTPSPHAEARQALRSASRIARPRSSLLMWWLSALATVSACWMTGLRLNLTGSLPVGFYLVSRRSPGRGATVLVCLPSGIAAFAKARGYVPRGGSCPGGLVPVGKVVWAVPGRHSHGHADRAPRERDAGPEQPTSRVGPEGTTAAPTDGGPVRGRPRPVLGAVDLLLAEFRLVAISGAVKVGQVRASLHPLWAGGPDR